MKNLIFAIILIFTAHFSQAQYTFSAIIRDTANKEPMQGVTVSIEGTSRTLVTDSSGKVVFHDLPKGEIKISFSFIGFDGRTIQFHIPQLESFASISLQRQAEKTEEAVIVSSSRTNSRIEDLPTKVEVLGSEEVGEENGIKPGNIASLLGDVAGIQIQQSSATTGNSEARVQGLPGKYTQILRDGLPLFGGYSGSFSILQIPPSDLKQIEIIKGASSTLYGGGAIAGMINLISKSPKLNKPEHAITINQSTLKESNINAYFSNRNKKIGYTFFTGGTYQRAVDVNKDGFSDVPDLKTFFLHPRIFWYPNARQTITAGYNLTSEDRTGGDMQVLHAVKDATHQFYIGNKSLRNTADAEWENRVNKTDKLTVKGTLSFYNRKVSTNVFGMNADQRSYYTEISYFKQLPKHNIVGGVNVTGEKFNIQHPDSSSFYPYNNRTIGFFIQDDWRISQKFTAQAGLRIDNHSRYGNFTLPRLSFLYRINPHFTTRLGGGLGYMIPSLFDAGVDERSYGYITYPSAGLEPERSKGMNWDINYKQVINNWHIIINQMFYVTEISKPLVSFTLPNASVYMKNEDKPVNTKGFETYVAATHDNLEIYFGYTYTVAKQLYYPAHPYVSLSARNKFASVIAYELTPHFRAGIEAAYTGKQYLDDGSRTPGYVFVAAMMRYDIKKISFVLNCENLFDYRQTRQEAVVLPPTVNPSFKQIWAPLDGRVINLSAKFSW